MRCAFHIAITHLPWTRAHLLACLPRLTNPLLLMAMGFLVGGFAAINKFGTLQFTCPFIPSPRVYKLPAVLPYILNNLTDYMS